MKIYGFQTLRGCCLERASGNGQQPSNGEENDRIFSKHSSSKLERR